MQGLLHTQSGQNMRGQPKQRQGACSWQGGGNATKLLHCPPTRSPPPEAELVQQAGAACRRVQLLAQLLVRHEHHVGLVHRHAGAAGAQAQHRAHRCAPRQVDLRGECRGGRPAGGGCSVFLKSKERCCGAGQLQPRPACHLCCQPSGAGAVSPCQRPRQHAGCVAAAALPPRHPLRLLRAGRPRARRRREARSGTTSGDRAPHAAQSLRSTAAHAGSAGVRACQMPCSIDTPLLKPRSPSMFALPIQL